jgi:hypothetical protein
MTGGTPDQIGGRADFWSEDWYEAASEKSSELKKLRRRLPTEIFTAWLQVPHPPSVMPTWFDTLKQSQSRVMVLIELGEDSTWVLMLVTRYRRPRGDEKAAILELTDDSGTV